MTYKLMSLAAAHVARLIGLVKDVEAVQLPGGHRREWGVLVRGRGFNRLIEDDILLAPTLFRPLSAYVGRPHVFPSSAGAKRFICSVGLTPFWNRHAIRNRSA